LAQSVRVERPIPGDVFVLEQAGAYGFAMASNYVSSLRPAELVVEDGVCKVARRRETIDDILRMEELGLG
jgi:diaminopimelate decarboxylase